MNPSEQPNVSETSNSSAQPDQTQPGPSPEPIPPYENPSTVAPKRAVRNLIEGTTRSKLYTLAAVLCFMVFGANFFGRANNQNLATVSVLFAAAGFLLGLFVMVRSTAREQGHSTAGQIAHIFKVLFIAGAVLLAVSIAIALIAIATGTYHQ